MRLLLLVIVLLLIILLIISIVSISITIIFIITIIIIMIITNMLLVLFILVAVMISFACCTTYNPGRKLWLRFFFEAAGMAGSLHRAALPGPGRGELPLGGWAERSPLGKDHGPVAVF